MTTKEALVTLAREQQTVLKSLMVKLFDKSLEGLNITKNEVQGLQDRHAWYHWNIYQVFDLKSKISRTQEHYDERIKEILSEIRKQKAQSKEILLKGLTELEIAMNTKSIQRYLKEMIYEVDKLVDKMPLLVLLGSIFGTFGLSSIIAAIIALFSGATLLNVLSMGWALIMGATASEIAFRNKISNLNEKLADEIEILTAKKRIRLQNLDVYFDRFVQRLHQPDGDNSSIDIVWFDRNVQNKENQSFVQRLSYEFSLEARILIEFDDETDSIEYVQSNIESNIILITSGSAGELVISEIGHYFNIKGIIIYCILVDIHQLWACKHKKMLLVTNNDDEVIEKIKQIKCGDIYFITHGYILDDVKQKNTKYLSTNEDGFAIQNFESINRDNHYHHNAVERLYHHIVSRNIYPNGIPEHFQLANLNEFVVQFLQALQQTKPEKLLLTLYSKEEAPNYYKIINDILNRFDEELIFLVGDYIKALRYTLIIYQDTTGKIPSIANVKFYRGLSLKHGTAFEEFHRKFKVNDCIIFPSFLSTSLDKNIAMSFTEGKGVLLEITADCTQVNKPKNISADSVYPNEDEVLLNCFQILKVTNISEITENLLCYECILTDDSNN